jgi:hypothetical protein
MEIYNYDHSGVYLGPSHADESPLEPGVFLIPANATTSPPPPPAENNLTVFSGGQWGYVPVNAPTTTTPSPEPATVFFPLPRSTFWLAALTVNVTKRQTLALINALPESNTKERMLILVEDAQEYHRDDPIVAQLASALGISATQLDALWLQAQNPSS